MLKADQMSIKYCAAYSIPLAAFLGIWLGGAWSFLTPAYVFVVIPLLELALPQEAANLTAEKREQAQVNRIYDLMLYVNVIIVYGLIWITCSTLATRPYSMLETAGMLFSLGIVLGTNGINVGHELGHRQDSWERYLGKFLLLPSLYMHFYIEHNFGHHLRAATLEDPATAHYNQSVYKFWFTSVVRQYLSAWHIQNDLLRRGGHGFFSPYNDMFWYLTLEGAYLALVFVLFGGYTTAFLAGAGVVGFLLLETVNYIEHYGLLRARLPSGRYERVREVHSWNSNHIMGRIVLYELTRHSDHHYKSSKKYQVLDCLEESPQMPYGYPTSMVISLIPAWWFRIMNPLVPEAMKPA